MAITALFTAANLRDALGPDTYMTIFDDNTSGSAIEVDASTPVQLIISRASVIVLSYLDPIYTTNPTAIGSELLRDCALQFGVVLSYRRSPELCSTYGAGPNGDLWKEAHEQMKALRTGLQRIPSNDSPPNGEIPVNNGANLITQNSTEADAGEPPKRWFTGGMGDF